MKKRKIIAEIILFAAGFAVLWAVFTNLFRPKYLGASSFASPETEMWTDFYDQEKDTIDVLYLGSSHIYNGVNPLRIYEATGLTGYDLATSSQDIATTYFLLEEALRFQSPKCVVLDVYGLVFESLYLDSSYKRTLDDMKWSEVKLEAIRAWQEHQPDEKIINRVFTLLDYHTRWEELTITDFNYRNEMQLFKGFSPIETITPIVLEPNEPNINIDPKEIDLEYLDRVVKLCAEQDIQLVLISVPHADWSAESKAWVESFAKERQLPFYDFNETEAIAEIGLDCAIDFKDRNHLNHLGSEKFSRFLSAYVPDWCGDPDTHDDSVYAYWDSCVAEWDATLAGLPTGE